MFDAGSIGSVLKLDMNPFAQGMLQAEGIASLFPSVVTNFMANPLLAVIDVAAKAAGAIKAVAAAWVEAIDAFGQKADDVGDKAEALGVSPEFLSGWGAAFEDAGSSADGLADALKFINKNAADAAAGNETAVKAFEAVGVSADFVRANLDDTEKITRAAVEGIAALPTKAQQTAAALDLMGRGAGEAIGALSGGTAKLDEFARHQERLGGIITAENAKAGDAYAKLRGDVETALEGIQKAAAAPVLFLISENLEAERKGVANAAEAIQAKIEELVWDAIKLGAMALDMVGMNEESLKRFLPHLQMIGDNLKNTVAGGFLVAATAAAAFADQLEAINKLLGTMGLTPGVFTQSALGSAAQLAGFGREQPGGPAAGSWTQRAQAAEQRYYDQKGGGWSSAGGDFGPGGGLGGGTTIVVKMEGMSPDQVGRQVTQAVLDAEQRMKQGMEGAARVAHARGRQ